MQFMIFNLVHCLIISLVFVMEYMHECYEIMIKNKMFQEENFLGYLNERLCNYI